VPTVNVDVDVSLDEFDDDKIAEYLRHRGYQVYGSGTPVTGDGTESITSDDLDHIDTLALCGQMEAAKAEALEVVSKAIGRNLH
jgi:hypothetical protein